MSKDYMRYDLLAQDALRGVVRMALERARDEGLPGGHHFYIAFATGFPGVEISEVLQARYPAEMTIVLQHQFWDLQVEQERFMVTLSFNKVPERLVVPFKAIKGFVDPSCHFGLNFQVEGEGDLEPAEVSELPLEASPGTPDAKDGQDGQDDVKPSSGTADVVSLDAFRKK